MVLIAFVKTTKNTLGIALLNRSTFLSFFLGKTHLLYHASVFREGSLRGNHPADAFKGDGEVETPKIGLKKG